MAFCCLMNVRDAGSNTQNAWMILTRQKHNTRVSLQWPDGVARFLAATKSMMEVIVVQVGGFAYYTKYFCLILNPDRTVRWVELQGIIQADLSVGGYILANEKGLECSCSRSGHGDYKYLVNFWMKPE